MSKKLKKKEDEIASEVFLPSLNEKYKLLFHKLLHHLSKALPIDRVWVIQNEIKSVEKNNNLDFGIEKLKYIASLHVLIDLSQQGWIFEINNVTLTLKMKSSNVDDKQKIRHFLSSKRNAQFKTKNTQVFVQNMEKLKNFEGNMISIRNLFGDPQKIIDAINTNKRFCKPYIQKVSNDKDKYTGYRLSDIWKYFRYTWSIPYRTTPGRNMYYLVRDEQQPYHPIIGIFALGNSVLNLTVRDNDIGWTVDSIKQNLLRKCIKYKYEQMVNGKSGKTISVENTKFIETEEEFLSRINFYSDQIYPLLKKNINFALSEIYFKDLCCNSQIKFPSQKLIDEFKKISKKYAALSINNKNDEKFPVLEKGTKSNLFIRKRASELSKLLSAKKVFQTVKGNSNLEKLNSLLATKNGCKAIHTALIANRKCKIGSNMMDIIVCGSIPPYNELLGGKLVSILSCSPTVIRDYTNRYAGQVSKIASQMKGEKVIRDSHLVYLGTTSLYAIGSSQYNRIKVPLENNFLEFRKIGITKGFGTVYFSKETTSLFSRLLELQNDGKIINHVFGEGASPRFRIISKGLSAIGIQASAFLKHYSPRIVYSINLAKNTNQYLLGIDNKPEYGFDIKNKYEVDRKTNELIDYWWSRWAKNRCNTVDLCQRLKEFNINHILLGNI